MIQSFPHKLLPKEARNMICEKSNTFMQSSCLAIVFGVVPRDLQLWRVCDKWVQNYLVFFEAFALLRLKWVPQRTIHFLTLLENRSHPRVVCLIGYESRVSFATACLILILTTPGLRIEGGSWREVPGQHCQKHAPVIV